MAASRSGNAAGLRATPRLLAGPGRGGYRGNCLSPARPHRGRAGERQFWADFLGADFASFGGRKAGDAGPARQRRGWAPTGLPADVGPRNRAGRWPSAGWQDTVKARPRRGAGDRRMRRDARLTRRHGRRKRARGTGGSERWLYVRSPIVYELITTGKVGRDRLVGQAVPNDVEGLRWLASGASLGRRMCSPCLRPSVHRVCGQVFSFCPDVFTFRPNVSSFRPDVSTIPADFPKCVHSARACVHPVP